MKKSTAIINNNNNNNGSNDNYGAATNNKRASNNNNYTADNLADATSNDRQNEDGNKNCCFSLFKCFSINSVDVEKINDRNNENNTNLIASSSPQNNNSSRDLDQTIKLNIQPKPLTTTTIATATATATANQPPPIDAKSPTTDSTTSTAVSFTRKESSNSKKSFKSVIVSAFKGKNIKSTKFDPRNSSSSLLTSSLLTQPNGPEATLEKILDNLYSDQLKTPIVDKLDLDECENMDENDTTVKLSPRSKKNFDPIQTFKTIFTLFIKIFSGQIGDADSTMVPTLLVTH